MGFEHAHDVVDQLAKVLELAGVAIILGGIVLASALFVRQGARIGWRPAYETYRSNLGRGILLGLELLVGADIISTITAPLTVESVLLLAGIVMIRTFLSFSLETEIKRGGLTRAALAPICTLGEFRMGAWRRLSQAENSSLLTDSP